MDPFYNIGIILLLVFALTWHYIRLRRISSRQIHSDYTLRQINRTLNWTQFILPTTLLGVGLFGNISVLMISLALSLFVSTIVEWVLTKKFVFDSFVIAGDNLISNDFKIKSFNLQALTIIDFLAFSDCLRLKFQGGQSVLIHRPDFDKKSLNIFFTKAIERSKKNVEISDDAKSKIYAS